VPPGMSSTRDSPEGVIIRVSRSIRVGLPAPAEARGCLDELASSIPAHRFQDLRLIVSELVTNAVQHAGLKEGDAIRVDVDVAADRIRVEVADFGTGFDPHPSVPTPGQARGWGLTLVEGLADRWGKEPGPGTRVWAELTTA
jgi:anti-sigma regulatory factor (Ser/Thr protein kinase)